MRPCATCARVCCVRHRSWSVACSPFPLCMSLCRVGRVSVCRVSAFPVSVLNFTPQVRRVTQTPGCGFSAKRPGG
eukprot:6589825-Prymnesium_polylepis.1